MTKQKAIELASQVWCQPKTQHKDMDVELAEAFADVLVKETTMNKAPRDEIGSIENRPQTCGEAYPQGRAATVSECAKKLEAEVEHLSRQLTAAERKISEQYHEIVVLKRMVRDNG